MSYNIRSQKWGDPTRGTESGEIEWSMDLSGGLRMASGYTMSDFTAAMQAAFDKWESVADIDFTYVGGSGGEVDVDMALLTGSTVGRATWNGGSVINFGYIEMDTEVTWRPGIPGEPSAGTGGTNFYAVALHEIGHVLGFNHVVDTTEIMNGYVSTGDLGDGDITGAQVLYGAGGASPPPEGPSGDPPPSLTTPSAGSDGDSGGAGAAILGLLALIAGLVFGLGSGGALFAAAATAAPGDGDEDPAEDDDVPVDDEVLLTDLIPDTGEVFTHNVYLTEADLIAAEGEDWAEHDHAHGACGCEGPCACHQEEMASGDVLLTDLIPVTGLLDEHSCGIELVEDEDLAEDLLLV